MMEAYLPMMKSAAMITAAQIGIFHQLHQGPRPVEEIARACRSSERGVKSLLDALESFRLVTRIGERYANSAFITEHFTPAAGTDFTPGLLWSAEAWRIMSGLTDAVRSGAPTISLWRAMQSRPEMGTLFSAYMQAFAHYFSPTLLAVAPISANARRLLDVGGSHGLHCVAFCRRYPGLTADIFDLPESLAGTAAIIAEHDLAHRINVLPGDATKFVPEGPYDVVLLLSVLHNQTTKDGEAIIRRIARATAPGGVLVIHEHFKSDPSASFAAVFNLTLLVEVGTETLAPEKLHLWLRAAGFDPIAREDLPGDGMGSLVVARRT